MMMPETIVGIATSVVGTAGAYLIARYQAKRQDRMGDKEGNLKWAGELSEDNTALRQEIRQQRSEIRVMEIRVRLLESYILITLQKPLP